MFTKIFILSRHNDGWYGITFKIIFYLASAKQPSLSSMTIRESSIVYNYKCDWLQLSSAGIKIHENLTS